MVQVVRCLTRFSADKGRLPSLDLAARLADPWMDGLDAESSTAHIASHKLAKAGQAPLARASVRKRRAPWSFIVIPFRGPAHTRPVRG